MAIFAAIQHTVDQEKSKQLLPRHLEFLKQNIEQGNIHATGPFTDGAGGMILYLADSLDDAKKLAESDPFIKEHVSDLEIHEWVDTKERIQQGTM